MIWKTIDIATMRIGNFLDSNPVWILHLPPLPWPQNMEPRRTYVDTNDSILFPVEMLIDAASQVMGR